MSEEEFKALKQEEEQIPPDLPPLPDLIPLSELPPPVSMSAEELVLELCSLLDCLEQVHCPLCQGTSHTSSNDDNIL